jgi:cytoskeleton protein RodZ
MADSEQSIASASSAPEPETVGEILRNARVARDLSLEQVSAELRIEPQQLDALEQNRFERIGVPVFVKGYLRQYAARLGLDPRDVLARYDRQAKLRDVEIQPSKTIKLHDERQITVWVVAALVLVALIVGLATWWLNGGGFTLSGSTAVEGAAPAPASTAQPEPGAAVRSTSDAAAVVPVSGSGEPVRAPTSDAETGTREEPAPPAAVPPSAVPVPAGPNASAAEPPQRGAYVASLDVAFEQESWAEINDARGQRLFYGLGAAGRKAELRGEPPFAVVLGNSAGVRLTLDGQDYPVPTSGRPGDYARFTVDVVEE